MTRTVKTIVVALVAAFTLFLNLNPAYAEDGVAAVSSDDATSMRHLTDPSGRQSDFLSLDLYGVIGFQTASELGPSDSYGDAGFVHGGGRVDIRLMGSESYSLKLGFSGEWLKSSPTDGLNDFNTDLNRLHFERTEVLGHLVYEDILNANNPNHALRLDLAVGWNLEEVDGVRENGTSAGFDFRYVYRMSTSAGISDGILVNPFGFMRFNEKMSNDFRAGGRLGYLIGGAGPVSGLEISAGAYWDQARAYDKVNALYRTEAFVAEARLGVTIAEIVTIGVVWDSAFAGKHTTKNQDASHSTDRDSFKFGKSQRLWVELRLTF